MFVAKSVFYRICMATLTAVFDILQSFLKLLKVENLLFGIIYPGGGGQTGLDFCRNIPYSFNGFKWIILILTDLLGRSHQAFFTKKPTKVRKRKLATAMRPVSH